MPTQKLRKNIFIKKVKEIFMIYILNAVTLM